MWRNDTQCKDMFMFPLKKLARKWIKLEQLERLRFENTTRRPIITPAMDLYQIPCHNKTKSNLQIPKICLNSNVRISQQPLYASHPLKLFDKMCEYEMDPASIMDGQTDSGRTTWSQYTPFQLRWSRGIRIYSAWSTKTLTCFIV